MAKQSDIAKEIRALKSENRILLAELEDAYKNMEAILVQSEREKEITYRELEHKYHTLQHTYTELSRKENMLIHMEKLSSIGQFITEIVHELRNPLTVIGAAIDVVFLNDLPEESRNILEKIPEQIKRMSSMLRRFKAMAYKEKAKFTIFDINKNIEDFIDTLELITPKSIKVTCELSVEELLVMGDGYQLTQIYLNLSKNAFDAMNENTDAQLKIRTELVSAAKINLNDQKYYCQKPDIWKKIVETVDNFAVIEFVDNGTGIPDVNLEYLFDSFFTTKERGKGTGLGLSISMDIAKKHNANITINSEDEKGTTFQVLIPIAGKEESLNKILS
jgi:signal transduction histidine kinase